MSEPIAVVGMACRFPGADSVQEFWQLLADGRDEIREVPEERWAVDRFYHPDLRADGKCVTRWGSFLDRVQDFDAEFFGITAAEAERVDPQQRLMLEVAWHALEDAGIGPGSLSGSMTGVFVGVSHSDYERIIYREIPGIQSYDGTGAYHALTANRVSFSLNLKGPSMVVDTACSSFLSSLHVACRSLVDDDCSLALCGAVNLNLTPEETIGLTKGGLLSPDGRCKTFDHRANGYVRGEGLGVVVLRRLEDAVRSGDRIRGVILGTGTNANGTANGIMAPLGPAQEVLIRRVLGRAGVEAADVSYIEAHGTGTAIGDTIEMGALRRVFAGKADDRRCAIGSLKTNIGHLESASGVASLIKVLLMFEHEEIPPHIHYEQPLPFLKLEATRLFVPTERLPWRREERRRIAALSAFGFGGSNGHAVIAEPPPATGATRMPERSELLLISGGSLQGLRANVDAHIEALRRLPASDFADYCRLSRLGRTHMARRRAVVARTPAAALAELDALPVRGDAVADPPKIGLLLGASRPIWDLSLSSYPMLAELRVALERRVAAAISPANAQENSLVLAAFVDCALTVGVLQRLGAALSVVCANGVAARAAAALAAGLFDIETGAQLCVSAHERDSDLTEKLAGADRKRPRCKLIADAPGASLADYLSQAPRAELGLASSKELARETSLVVSAADIASSFAQRASEVSWCELLDEEHRLERVAAKLFEAGCNLSCEAIDDGRPRRVVDLPLYAFQRRPYWVQPYTPRHPPEAGTASGLLSGTASELYQAQYHVSEPHP